MKTPLLHFIVLPLFTAFPIVGEEASDNSAFGSSQKSAGTMIGIFYDLKQNQRREPVTTDYLRTLGQFLDSGWDESVLSRFFRGTKPIYATEVFIPNMGAGGAPKAFDLENVVRPSNWFVIYKGQVSPPEDGTYRFVGIADDVLAVGVNGRTVLVSHFGGWANHSRWRDKSPQESIKVEAGKMRRGDWFDCKKEETIDLDILIGEYPGTAFGAWLLIEKKGVRYPVVNDPKHGEQTVLPAFQVRVHPLSPRNQGVPFSTDARPWVCHQ